MDSLWIHRLEMMLVDLTHLFIILVVGLFCIALLVWGGTTGEFLVPWLTPAVGGLTSRLDALVFRKGLWLREQGHDAWEAWKQHHKVYASVVATSDILMGLIILVCLVHAEHRVMNFSWENNLKGLYLAITLGINIASVANIVSMSMKIARDYDAVDQHQ